MPAIPLRKYAKEEYPLTPKSTLHYWAAEAFYHNRGIFAGKIKRAGKRWYYILSTDPIVDKIVAEIRNSR